MTSSVRAGGVGLVLLVALVASVLAPNPAHARRGAAAPGSLALVATPVTLVGESVSLTVTARPARTGGLVRVQTRRAGRWVVVARARQDARGVVRARVTRPPAGLLRLRAVTTGRHRATSPVVLARVVPGTEEVPRVPGQEPDLSATDLDVSGDARMVVFTARAGVGTGTGASASRVRAYAFDRVTRTTLELPAPAGTTDQQLPEVSATGRFVTHLAGVAGGGLGQLMLTDLATGRTRAVAQVSGFRGADVSSDGRFVAFTAARTGATCVHAAAEGGGGRDQDVVVLDRTRGSLTCVTSGLQLGYLDQSGRPTLSSDGATVSFVHQWLDRPNGQRHATLVVQRRGQDRQVVTPDQGVSDRVTDGATAAVVRLPRPGSDVTDIGVRDLGTGAVEVLTADYAEGGLDGAISADGSFVHVVSSSADVTGPQPQVSPYPSCVYRRRAVDATVEVVACGVSVNDYATSGDGTALAWTTGEHRLMVRTLRR